MEECERPKPRDDSSEHHADQEENPPITLPQVAESRSLRKDIGNVRGTVGYVRQDGKDEQQENAVQFEAFTRFRPAKDEIDNNNRRQHDVVDETSRFPITHRIGSEVPDRLSFHDERIFPQLFSICGR